MCHNHESYTSLSIVYYRQTDRHTAERAPNEVIIKIEMEAITQFEVFSSN